MGERVVRMDAPVCICHAGPGAASAIRSDSHVAIRHEAHGGIHPYAGTTGRQDTVDIRKQKVTRTDGSEISVNELLARDEALQKALEQAIREKLALTSEINILKAKLSPPEEAVIDSRYSQRADADDYDPKQRMNERLQNSWRENSGTSTRADSDEDPAAAAIRRREERFRERNSPSSASETRADARPLDPVEDPNSDDFDPQIAMQRRMARKFGR
jgi:hypothetical protein